MHGRISAISRRRAVAPLEHLAVETTHGPLRQTAEGGPLELDAKPLLHVELHLPPSATVVGQVVGHVVPLSTGRLARLQPAVRH